MLLDVVQVAQTIQHRRAHLHVMLLEELLQHHLATLLYLPVLPAQDSLDLSSGLGRANEVHPGGLYMLRVAGEDLHLVAALQFITDGDKLVVHLGADTMAA